MSDFLQNLRYSVRQFLRSPGFTLVALLTLIFAVGANSAIFSVIRGVLLRPLPFEQPDRLVTFWNSFSGDNRDQVEISEPEYLDLLEQNDLYSSIAAYNHPISYILGGGTEPEQTDGATVTASLFDVLRGKAALGRTFTPEDEVPGANPVAILSDAVWHRRYAADPNVLGKTILLDGESVTIVGVMAPEFRFPAGIDLWRPFVIDKTKLKGRGSHYFQVVARLKDGASFAQAQSGATRFARLLQQRYLHEYPRGDRYNVRVIPLQTLIVGNVRAILFLLLGAVGVLLLIACANLANLLLARAQARSREIAVRSALGAARGRLVRQFLLESLLLGLTGGALGLVAATWTTKALVAINQKNIPRADEIQLDGTVLLFTFGISIFAVLLFGVVPALKATGRDLTQPLRESSTGATTRRGNSLRTALVVAQIALALVLSVSAGLVVRSLVERQKVDPGFEVDRLLTLKITPSLARYAELPQRIDLYRRITERLRALPGVESAGAVSNLPLSSAINLSGTFEVEGRPVPQGSSLPEADRRTTTPGYFETLGIRLLDGRTFDERDQDVPDGGSVIVDDVLAKRYWSDQTPIGRRLRTGNDKPWLTVVGVVGHVHHQGPGIETRQQVYFPYTQIVSASMYLVVRTSQDPLTLVDNVRAAIRQIDPGLPVYDVQTMEGRWRESLAKPRLASAILSIFAAVALLLAAIGIYGVTTYSVTQRTPEIGIRLALGAQPRGVLRMILLQALRLTLIGAAIGLLAAWAAARVFTRLLYSVSPLDPTAYLAVALALAVAALIAGLVPAVRATRVDPNASLRVI